MIRFKFDVLKALKEKGYTTLVLLGQDSKGKTIRDENGNARCLLGNRVLQELRENRESGKVPRSIDVLNTICKLLEIQPGDLLEYVPDEE